jgi:Acetylglutamate semialdehyde dehydrogenase
MKHKIFVDGQEGTTGLKIYEYLNKREDIEVLLLINCMYLYTKNNFWCSD